MGKFIKKKPSTKTANFKMYKAGKHWLFTFSTLTFLAGGAGFVFSGNQAVHADSNDNQRVIGAASAQTAAAIHQQLPQHRPLPPRRLLMLRRLKRP